MGPTSRPATILREATTLRGGLSHPVAATVGTAAIYAVAPCAMRLASAQMDPTCGSVLSCQPLEIPNNV